MPTYSRVSASRWLMRDGEASSLHMQMHAAWAAVVAACMF